MSRAATRISVKPHPGQAEVHNNPARFRVLACGRRWGKTRLGVNECLDVAASGGRAWWVAPNYKMSRVGWRPLSKIGRLIGADVRKGDLQITMPGGGEITVRSANDPYSLRGEGLDFVVLDECAFMAEEAWTESLRPALSDRGGRAMFISTPKGRNWFWRLYQRGLGNDREWQSWRRPTSDNPYIKPTEIDQARADMPEVVFEQEYMAVFLENMGSVFRSIAKCLTAPPDQTRAQHERHNIVMGVDWAKEADFTAFSLICTDCHREVARDRFNKIDYDFQTERLKNMVGAWHPAGILPERNSIGGPLVDGLVRQGLPILSGPDGKPGFETTVTSKPQLIENLSLALDRGEIAFQADDVWTGELEAYERKISPMTGRSHYSAPEGLHDDTVIARALAVWAIGRAASLPAEQPTQASKWGEIETDGESRWRRY